MKKKLLKTFIVIVLMSIAGFAAASTSNTIFFNNNYPYSGTNGVVIINKLPHTIIQTEYQCKIFNSNCVVTQIKDVQRGSIDYDSSCQTSRITKPEYENNVRDDVSSGRFEYCVQTSKTVKESN